MIGLLPPHVIDDHTKTFLKGCREHTLIFQQCHDCGHIRWPLSFVCPKCSSQRVEWIQSEGKGRVYTYIVFHTAFHPDFIGKTPYVVAIIELNEGLHFLAKIIGCNHTQIHCNMEVEVVWEDVSSELSLPSFQPLIVPLSSNNTR
jgi:hypothetical protein